MLLITILSFQDQKAFIRDFQDVFQKMLRNGYTDNELDKFAGSCECWNKENSLKNVIFWNIILHYFCWFRYLFVGKVFVVETIIEP